MWSRDDVVDVIFREDECIVLTSTTCLRMSPVSAAVIELLEHPRTQVDLGDQLDARFGVAPDGRLDEILGQLADQGVVRRQPDHPLG